MLDIAREKRLLVQLGYMFRYNAGFQFILDWAKSGKLGELSSVRARISTGPSDEAHWKRWDSRGEREGGIMFILACHLIDTIVALLGRPDSVTAFSLAQDKEYPWFRDNTAAIFEYSEAMATIESVAREVSSGESRRLEVYGTRGSAILEPLEPPTLRLCLDEDRDGYVKGWQHVPVENGRATSRACEPWWRTSEARKRPIAHSTMNSPCRRRFCGRRGFAKPPNPLISQIPSESTLRDKRVRPAMSFLCVSVLQSFRT